jgi:hypothetical protein
MLTKSVKNKIALCICINLFMPAAYSWDGTDNQGKFISIESDNLVRQGNDIEIYEYETGQYKDVSVEGINSFGLSTEIEVYDWNGGGYRNFEMD